MGHDASKVLLGQVPHSSKEISVFTGDPATFKAGLAVSKTSTGREISLLKSAGMRCGISLGASLSDHKKTAVVRDGLEVPIRLALKRASGSATITAYANLVSGTPDTLSVAGTAFAAQAGAATPGTATFQAATSNNATATSLAAQINAHATVGLKVVAVASGAVVTIYARDAGVGSTGTGNDVAVAYTNNDANVGLTLAGLSGGKLAGGSNAIADVDFAAVGQKVYINDTTGEADAAIAGLSTISDATYGIIGLSGIAEDKSLVPAAQINMPGGL